MFTFIFIIGIVIILWPLIGGALTWLFNVIAYILSGLFYWIMRLIKRPITTEDNDKNISIAVTLAFITIIAALFTILII